VKGDPEICLQKSTERGASRPPFALANRPGRCI